MSRRPVSALAALLTLAGFTLSSLPGWGATTGPQDPFGSALPSRDTTAPETRDAGAGGNASVIEQTGAASYAYPFALPPGRLGMAPSLALSYSSQNPLRGGIAVGWTMALPTIEKDPDVLDGTAYRAGDERLVPAPEDPGTGDPGDRYRAERDASYTRYEYDPGKNVWTARSLGGVTRTFAKHHLSTRWHLTEEVDAFGNAVTYSYTWSEGGPSAERLYGEWVLSEITYTSNPAANLGPHAKVELVRGEPESCGGVPVGAALDHHFFTLRMTGSRRLNEVRVSVRDEQGGAWRVSKRYQLRYDEQEEKCTASALRYLTGVEVTAYDAAGTPTVAPPVSFGYGPAHRALTESMYLPDFGGGELGVPRGPTQMLLDFDGDGWVDRLEILQEERCRLKVTRGTGIGDFKTWTVIDLPSAPWADGDVADSQLEGCSLSGQLAFRGYFAAESGNAPCRVESAIVTYDFRDWDGDGLVDILSNLYETRPGIACENHDACDFDVPYSALEDNDTPGCTLCWPGTICIGDVCACDPHQGCMTCTPPERLNPFTGECEAPQCGDLCTDDDGDDGGGDEDDLPGDPEDLPPEHVPPPGSPVEACSPITPAAEVNDVGDYIIHVQHNLGDVVFETIDEAMEVRSPAPLPMHQLPRHVVDAIRPGVPTLIDITGDGLLDIVSLEDPPEQDFTMPMPGSEPYLYVWAGTGGEELLEAVPWSLPFWDQRMMLADWNDASGVLTTPSTVELRDMNADGLPDIVAQTEFGNLVVAHNFGGAFLGPVPLELSGPVDVARAEHAPAWEPPDYIADGARAQTMQLVDTDDDGYPEQLVMPTSGGVLLQASQRRVRHLRGGTFHAEEQLDTEWEPLEHAIWATDGLWYRSEDAVDVTGDGRVDMVTWLNRRGAAFVQTDSPWSAPPRLLTTIENGRGATTHIEYAPSTTPGLVTMGEGHLSARDLVARIVVDPGSGSAWSSTSYQYADPHHGKDGPLDRGAAHFQGFGTVTIDRSGQLGPASARKINSYSFALLGGDGGGRLVEELSLARTETGVYEARARVVHHYRNLYLLGGVPNVTVEDQTISSVCAAGATAASCAQWPASTRTVSTVWTAFVLGGSIAHYQQTWSDAVASGTPTARTATTQYLVRSTPSEYRQIVVEVKGGDATSTLARTVTVPDARLLPYETVSFRSATESTTTRRKFDLVGNVQWEMRPSEVVGAQRATWFEYDSHQLFPVRVINELGHEIRSPRDVSTGIPTGQHRGPDPDDESVIVNDGFGRLLERWETTAPDGQLRLVERYEYDDGIPNRVIARRVQDHATGAEVVTETVHDGLGRVIETIAHRQLSGEPDAVTRYRYDNAGALYEQDVPDPRVDDGSVVTYRWIRDGAGRVISTVRPDGSGVDVVYDGTSTETTERSPQETRTTAITDGFGNLREVWEHPANKPTAYRYDALGRLFEVRDADGHVTTMVHDGQDNRTAIIRGGRWWTYAYDLDGNLEVELAPVPPGASPVDYATIVEYDVLGRVEKINPARRDLSSSELTRFGVGAVVYHHDVRRVGAIDTIELPFGSIDFEYDADGRVWRETRSIDVPETSVSTTQWVERDYDALGAPRTVRWDDGTEWVYVHDARAMVERVDWNRPGVGPVTLASYVRSVAGAPRDRISDAGQWRQWSYDELGRPVHDRVWNPTTGVGYAERSYGYDGDDLAEIWGEVDGLVADATYRHDARHRLEIADGPLDYSAELAYGATGNIDAARVAGVLDQADRDVTYRYASFEPQAVEALIDSAGSEAFSMGYDLSGNLAKRIEAGGGSSLFMRWDGEDQLREVQAGGGTETYLFAPGAERLAAIGPDGVKLWFAESETHFDRDGSQQRRYHHVATGEPIARIGEESVELQYADTLQNLMLALAEDGSVRAAFLYGAFGELVAATGDADHRRQFNGKEHDAVSGLRHYGYRSYDPVLLRWVSADPLYRMTPEAAWTEPQRANLYAFSLNNPVRWMDPDGRQVAPDAGVVTDEGSGEPTDAGVPCGDGMHGPEAQCDSSGNGVAPAGELTLTGRVLVTTSEIVTPAAVLAVYTIPRTFGGWIGMILGMCGDRAGSCDKPPPPEGTDGLVDPFLPPRVGMSGFYPPEDKSRYVNLASEQRTNHILTGDATGGGHKWSFWRMFNGKSKFPMHWSKEKIMDGISDVATNPASTRVQQTGVFGSMFTRSGDHVKWRVEGVYDGVKIRVIVKGDDIITGFPIP